MAKKKVNKKYNKNNKIVKEVNSTHNKINGNKSNKEVKKKKTIKTNEEPIWKKILLVAMCLFIIGMLALGVFFIYVIKTSPEFDPNKLYDTQISVLLTKDGQEFAKVGSENREIVTYDLFPEVLIDAIVATEDSRFFQHNGFDLPRFTVATIKQLLGNHNAGGASTLTMQISKNKLTSNIASGLEGILRKFQDIYISIFKIEKYYTKQEILEFYLNANWLGGNAHGVQAASKQYFGKDVKDLTLPEAAMIVGIFNAPAALEPYSYPENCENRRQEVLYLMKRHGYITQEEYDSALKMTVSTLLNNNNKHSNSDYQGFINTLVEDVYKETNKSPYTTPMRIKTTMDKEQQEYIEQLMRGELSSYKWENDKVQAGVAVINSKDGSVSAIGAGRNRNELDFNYATSISNHIGSTAKPLYDYGPAIEYLNWGSGTLIIDESWNYTNTNVYINNWTGKFSGFASVRESIIDSKNIPALKTFQSVPNNKIYNYVKSFGLHPEASGNVVHESHSLGGYDGENPLSLAAAYNVYSNGGYYIEPYTFTSIEFIETGEVYTHKPAKKRVVSEETAYIITDILIDTVRSYDYSYVNGVTYAGKSGTANLPQATITENNLPSNAVNDLWLAGYNGSYAIAIWYGYDYITSSTYNKFGSQQNTRLFQAVAKKVFTSSLDRKMPNGVIEVTIEDDTNLLASEFTPKNLQRKELYKKGSEPTEVSNRFSQLTNVTNLKAEVSGNDVTLTWDKIKTPNAIDDEYLNKYFNSLFRDKNTMNKYLTERLNYNKNNIGNITYDIYEKDSEGNLTFISSTSDDNITIPATSANYVVKTSYSIFKDNASTGVDVSIDAPIIENKIKAVLIKELITINLNSEYVFDHDWVVVYKNDEEVDKNLVTITVDSKGVDTTTVGDYKVIVNVKYDNYEDTLTQIVKVK